MLGILFIYFIGKYYYTLAQQYDQNKWGYAIVGVVIYYVTTFAFGVIVYFIDIIFELNIDWDKDNKALGLLGIPVGILGCYIVYTLLKKKWENQKLEIETIDAIGEDSNV